jgi:RNA polymerase sigma-70 factor (ECF subfamily)
MSSSKSKRGSTSKAAGRFATTHWSLVVSARDPESPEARKAIASLCAIYSYPLYAHIRHQGHSREDAEDLTQDFLTKLVEKDYLVSVDRRKGKFRSFLLACCNHFLANVRDYERAKKRGGGTKKVSLDFATAERRYGTEPRYTLTAERLFARRWALTLLDQVLGRLRGEFESMRGQRMFAELEAYLTADSKTIRYAEAAKRLQLTEAAVRVLALLQKDEVQAAFDSDARKATRPAPAEVPLTRRQLLALRLASAFGVSFCLIGIAGCLFPWVAINARPAVNPTLFVNGMSSWEGRTGGNHTTTSSQTGQRQICQRHRQARQDKTDWHALNCFVQGPDGNQSGKIQSHRGRERIQTCICTELLSRPPSSPLQR